MQFIGGDLMCVSKLKHAAIRAVFYHFASGLPYMYFREQTLFSEDYFLLYLCFVCEYATLL